MRASLLLSGSVLALFTLAAAACSSSTVARAFDDDDAGTTTDMPEQTSTPTPDPTGTGPVSTGGDAGVGPDGASDCKTTPPSNKCGLADQCGCTLAETCDVTDNAGGVSCVVAGLGAMGAPCVSTSGCARGLTCSGTCHAYCDNPGGACSVPKTGACIQLTDSKDAGVPNDSVCEVACDLRDATACGGSTPVGVGVCGTDGKGGTDCYLGGTAALGASCDTVDCGPALVCVTSGSTNTCKKWCKVGSTDCGGSTTCTGFSTKEMVGTTEFGVCP